MEHCTACSGPLKLIAVTEHATVIEKILTHLNLNTPPPPRAPVRYGPNDEAELYWNPVMPINALGRSCKRGEKDAIARREVRELIPK